MKQAPDKRSLLWSVISLFVGGWIVLECAAALGDLIRTGAFKIPSAIVKGPAGIDPVVVHYATEPGWTVALAAVTVIAGLLGICAAVFGITDLWKKALAASEET